MVDALKRISKAKDAAFQDRCTYYLYQKALMVINEATPDADQLLLAKAVVAGQVSIEDVSRIVVTNHDIGASIDADETPVESSIEYVILSGTAFTELATSYKAAGLIGA